MIRRQAAAALILASGAAIGAVWLVSYARSVDSEDEIGLAFAALLAAPLAGLPALVALVVLGRAAVVARSGDATGSSVRTLVDAALFLAVTAFAAPVLIVGSLLF